MDRTATKSATHPSTHQLAGLPIRSFWPVQLDDPTIHDPIDGPEKREEERRGRGDKYIPPRIPTTDLPSTPRANKAAEKWTASGLCCQLRCNLLVLFLCRWMKQKAIVHVPIRTIQLPVRRIYVHTSKCIRRDGVECIERDWLYEIFLILILVLVLFLFPSPLSPAWMDGWMP